MHALSVIVGISRKTGGLIVKNVEEQGLMIAEGDVISAMAEVRKKKNTKRFAPIVMEITRTLTMCVTDAKEVEKYHVKKMRHVLTALANILKNALIAKGTEVGFQIRYQSVTFGCLGRFS